ncbi:hypothetical protein K2Y11_02770 [bacterium]|nr:hypothetical protein [bacterium]
MSWSLRSLLLASLIAVTSTSLTGCGEHTPTADKMSGDKMSGDKMSGDKMSGDKMSDEKMSK